MAVDNRVDVTTIEWAEVTDVTLRADGATIAPSAEGAASTKIAPGVDVAGEVHVDGGEGASTGRDTGDEIPRTPPPRTVDDAACQTSDEQATPDPRRASNADWLRPPAPQTPESPAPAIPR